MGPGHDHIAFKLGKGRKDVKGQLTSRSIIDDTNVEDVYFHITVKQFLDDL
ncbi:protein of unknown function [Oenococcus oeni]|nr:hypothetical protein OENI_10171 [Oenococcus oeni]SYW19028.1 hypothetical protein OENI_60173 [Oenococcus oeni]VDC15591.1 protein of unknown function [Oenococcus oeni]